MMPTRLSPEEVEALGELSQGEGVKALNQLMQRLVVEAERKALAQDVDTQIAVDTRRAQGARWLATEVADALERLRRGGSIRRK